MIAAPDLLDDGVRVGRPHHGSAMNFASAWIDPLRLDEGAVGIRAALRAWIASNRAGF
jgi:hypothetical protein